MRRGGETALHAYPMSCCRRPFVYTPVAILEDVYLSDMCANCAKLSDMCANIGAGHGSGGLTGREAELRRERFQAGAWEREKLVRLLSHLRFGSVFRRWIGIARAEAQAMAVAWLSTESRDDR